MKTTFSCGEQDPQRKEKMKEPENKYKVAKSQWKKWPNLSKAVFNEVYSEMCYNEKFFLHTEASVPPTPHWKVTAWNSAWIAAQAVKDTLREMSK